MADANTDVADIGKPDRICMDCGKLFLLCHAGLEDDITICPRCSSPKHDKYVEAEHQQIEITVPDDYQHPLEDRARVIFERVQTMTGWRESKVRLWFQLANPLLGNVPPENMIMAGEEQCARLEKFIDEAEELNRGFYGQQATDRDHAGKQGQQLHHSGAGEPSTQ